MRKLITGLLLLILLFPFATPAFADEGKVLFGEDFILKTGDKYEGDVVIFGGRLEMEEGSYLKGDVVVFGQSAVVAGNLDGSLVVFGGDIEVKSTATIEEDVVLFGGKISKEEGAVIRGQQVEMALFGWMGRLPWGQLGYFTSWRGGPGFRYFDVFTGFVFGLLRYLLTTLALIAVGILIFLFWPEQVELVGETVLKAPLVSGGVGLAVLVLGIPVGLVLILAACLGLVVWLALIVATLFGFTAIASLVGNRLLKAFNPDKFSPILAVLLGVIVLRLLDLVPCLGFILSGIVYSLGLGAVILTRFGTQPYPQVVSTALAAGEEAQVE